MKFSTQWLQKLVKLDVNSQVLAEQLTFSGLEVELLDGEIIEVAVMPNRADCLGMLGIAREAATLNNIEFKAPYFEPIPAAIQDKITLQVKNSSACPKYLGRIIKGVDATQPTPQWIKDCLTTAGMDCISAIVDITNYVLIEWGQPLHAFDLAKIKDQNIVVRNASKGECLTLLDESVLELDTESLVIADAEKPLALAGIKGGFHSGIYADTKDVLIECAYFEPIGVRLSSRRNGLQTDGSYRFERGIDPLMQEQVMEYVTQLILNTVGGKAGPIMAAVDATHMPKPVNISLRLSRISRILGIVVPPEKVKDILQQLGMQVSAGKISDELLVKIPSFRTDLALEVDLVEEVARIYGFDKIPVQLPTGTLAFSTQHEAVLTEAQVIDCLINRGYNEAITYSFIDSELAKLFVPKINEEWLVTNPIASDMNLMRPSLLPGLVAALQYNQNRQQSRVRLFEIGLRFVGDEKHLQQIKTVAGVCCGSYYTENWASPAREVDFYDLKGDIEGLFRQAGNISKLEFKAGKNMALHPGQNVDIFLSGSKVGTLGTLNPAIQQKLGLATAVCMFELDYTAVVNGTLVNFKQVSKYPSVRRDLSLLVDKDLSADKLKSVINQEAGALLTDVVIFDIYQGKGIPAGKKSVGLGFTLQDPDRTLTEQEVNELFAKIVAVLQHEFEATLR